MSEPILKALMQLFAIIANPQNQKESISQQARTIVKQYLEQHLSQEQLQDYLKLFDDFVEQHHGFVVKADGTKIEKRTAANSVKVLKICQQINEELEQQQKFLVLLQLLEFINENNTISEQEYDFVRTVADVFNIPDLEFRNIKSFIIDTVQDIPEQNKVLIIDSIETSIESDLKFILSPNLDGEIIFLHLETSGMYVFKYLGNDDLYLNGHNIVPKRVYIYDIGSTIRSSKISPIYYSNIVSKYLLDHGKTQVTFTAKEIEFKFKNSSNGVWKFNFCEESGQMIGIMGGSGVGKSTLLNVFNGNLRPTGGQIYINGFDIHDDKDKLEGFIGFVPQDDLLIDELSVYQNLYYNAKLCFRGLSEEDVNKRVDKVLIDLGLFEIRHLKVGDPLNKYISGGQRKRLNIALELIREPIVMFVDEPTSGLSSNDSELVMDLLKEQSMKGKLIIVNIHQPSSDIYKLFDKLMIVDKGGRIIFQGNPIDAVVYFKKMSHHVNAEESQCLHCGNVNPEQVLQIVEARVVNEYGKLTYERKVTPTEWYEMYKRNIEEKMPLPVIVQETLPINQFKIPGKLQQFKIFSIRNILSKFTNTQYLLVNFLEAPLLAIILGLFTKYVSGLDTNPEAYVFMENENIPAFLFMSVVVSLFIGLTVSAEEIIKDKRILKREQFLNLSKMSYINSKIVVLFAISAIQTISYVVLGNLILGIEGMTLSYFMVLFSAASCANMIGLNISAALDSVVTIYILIPLILVPQLLLSGVIVKFDKLHKNVATPIYVPVPGDMMTLRWAYEALAVEQFKHNEYQKNLYEVEQKYSEYGFKVNYLLPELEARLGTLSKPAGKKEEKEKKLKNLAILKREIEKLQPLMNFELLNKMDEANFKPDMIQKIEDYIMQVRKYYEKKLKEAERVKEKKFEDMIKQFKGKDNLILFQQKFQNSSLNNMMLNKAELNKIIEFNGELIQNAEPIYKFPDHKYGRAHFYSPVKILFGKTIDTMWFNIGVLWLMSLVLYFVLLFDGLRKGINLIGKLKFWKSKGR